MTELFPLVHEWLCVESSFSSCTSVGLLRWFALGWSCPVLFLYTNCSSIFCCGMSCHHYRGLESGNPDETGWKTLSRFVWAPAALPHEKATCFQPAVSSVCSVHLFYPNVPAGKHTLFTPSIKKFKMRMVGDLVSCFKGKTQCAITVL